MNRLLVASQKTATMETKALNDQIGDCAGMIWNYLDGRGEVAISRLVRELDMSRDMLQRGIGWLAREDKVVVSRAASAETIRLK